MPGTIFEDADFKAMRPDEQHAVLYRLSQSYRDLPEEKQWAFLNEHVGREAPSLSGALGAGVREGVATAFDIVPANVAMIARKGLELANAPDFLTSPLKSAEDLYRSRGEATMREASSQRGHTIPQKILEGLGALPPQVLEAVATGGSIPALAGLGAVTAANEGLGPAVRSAGVNALIGGALKVAAPFSAPVRALAAGGTAYALSNEPDPVRRAVEGATMAAMGALHSPERAELNKLADEAKSDLAAPEPPAPIYTAPKPPEVPARPRPGTFPGMPVIPFPKEPPPPELPAFPGRPLAVPGVLPEPPIGSPAWQQPLERGGQLAGAMPGTEAQPHDLTRGPGAELQRSVRPGEPGLDAEARLGPEVQGVAEGAARDPGAELVRPELQPTGAPLERPGGGAQGEVARPELRAAAEVTPPDLLYSEMSAQEAARHLGGNFVNSEVNIWASDNPALALGQGTNRGVRLTFDRVGGDPRGFMKSATKPGLPFSEVTGQGSEFRVQQDANWFQNAVRKVEILPRANASKTYRQWLERSLSGWKRTQEPDGTVSYARPGEPGEQSRAVTPPDYAKPADPTTDQWAPGPLYRGQRDVAQLPPDTPLRKKVADAGKSLERLTRALKIPVQQENMRSQVAEPGVLGYSRSNLSRFGRAFRDKALGTIRIKSWADVQTATHELFHALDQRFPQLTRWYDWRSDGKAQPDTPARTQINALSYDVQKPYEGAAEFARLWFTQKDYLKTVAPDAVSEFEQLGPRIFGPTWRAMLKAQKDMHAAFDQGGVASTLAKFNPPNRAGAALTTAADAARQVAVDLRHGIFAAARDIVGKDQAGLPSGIWALWQQLNLVGQMKVNIQKKGAPVMRPDGTINYIGKGLYDILAPVAKSRDSLRRFSAYLLGRHAKVLADYNQAELMKGGPAAALRKILQGQEEKIQNFLSPEQMKQSLAQETPEFATAYQELVNFREQVLQFAINAGIISDTAAAKFRFRGEMAMSLFRQFDGTPRGGGASGLRQGQAIHQMTGSSRPLKPMLDSLIEGPFRLIQESMVNIAKARLYKELLLKPGGGRWGERIPGERIDPATGAPVFTLFGAPKPADPNNRIMSFREKGVPVYVELFDPVLAQSVSMVHPKMANAMVRGLFLLPRKFQQAAITISPEFMLRQFPRDIMQAAMATRVGSQSPGMAPVTAMASIARSARGYVEALRQGDAWKRYEENLGGGGELRARDVKFRTGEVIRHARLKNGDPVLLLELLNPMNYYRALEHVGRAIEQGPRVGEYMALEKQGWTPREAAFGASEVTTNFSQQGSGEAIPQFGTANALLAGATHLLVNGSPFYRAMVAAGDRLYRSNLRDPNWKLATATRFAMVMGLSMAHYLWARDQDWFKDQADWNKETNWIFPPINLGTAEKPYMVTPTLSKNYDIAMVTNVPQRVVEELLSDPKDRSNYQLGLDLMGLFRKNFGVGLPTIPSLILEQYSNRSAFTGAPIESESAKNLEPWARTASRVPRVLEDLGVLEHRLGVPTDLQVSPSKADALFTSLMGSSARTGFLFADSVVHPADGVAMHPDDYPLLRVLMQREGKYTQTANDFYNLVEAATEGSATMREMVKQQRPELEADYLNNPVATLGKFADRVKRVVSDIRAQKQQVERDPSMTTKERQEAIDRMNEELERVQKAALEVERRYR